MTAALGGVCIEKHYTIDKTLPDVPDHAMSVEPPELAEMVRAADRAGVLRGDAWIGVRDVRGARARQNARRSIVLERDVAAGRGADPRGPRLQAARARASPRSRPTASSAPKPRRRGPPARSA